MKISYTLGPYPQLPKKRSDQNIQAQGYRKMRNQILDSGARVLGGPEPSRDGWAQAGAHRRNEHSPHKPVRFLLLDIQNCGGESDCFAVAKCLCLDLYMWSPAL